MCPEELANTWNLNSCFEIIIEEWLFLDFHVDFLISKYASLIAVSIRETQSYIRLFEPLEA